MLMVGKYCKINVKTRLIYFDIASSSENQGLTLIFVMSSRFDAWFMSCHKIFKILWHDINQRLRSFIRGCSTKILSISLSNIKGKQRQSSPISLGRLLTSGRSHYQGHYNGHHESAERDMTSRCEHCSVFFLQIARRYYVQLCLFVYLSCISILRTQNPAIQI